MISTNSSSGDKSSEDCFSRSNHAALLCCEVSTRVSKASATSVQVNISRGLAMDTLDVTGRRLPGERRLQHGGGFPMGILPMADPDRAESGRGSVRLIQQQSDRGRTIADPKLANGLLNVPVDGLGGDLQPAADLL